MRACLSKTPPFQARKKKRLPELALKINSLITENRRTSFNKLLDAGPRESFCAMFDD